MFNAMNNSYDVLISTADSNESESMAMCGIQWLGHATRKMFYMVTPTELALDDTDTMVSSLHKNKRIRNR